MIFTASLASEHHIQQYYTIEIIMYKWLNLINEG